jgi:gas vesicle protein
MKTSRILLGFAAGAAIGAALGILFAPDKGTETRRRISERGNDLADSVKEIRRRRCCRKRIYRV